MQQAFILGKIEAGKDFEVVSRLKKLEHIEYSYLVHGKVDFIAKLSAQNLAELNKAITKKVRQIGGLERTKVLFVAEYEEKE